MRWFLIILCGLGLENNKIKAKETLYLLARNDSDIKKSKCTQVIRIKRS